jgi:YHS domain-containing protein
MPKFKPQVFALVLAAFVAGSVLPAPPAALAAAQTTCPVMGGNINKSLYADYQGQRIYFCCRGCDAEFKKDPAKYLKKMEDMGVTPEAVPPAKGNAGK